MGFQRGRVVEPLDRGDLASDHAIEIRTHQRRRRLCRSLWHTLQIPVSASPCFGSALAISSRNAASPPAAASPGFASGVAAALGVASGLASGRAADCRSWCAGRRARRRAASHREVPGTAPSWSPARSARVLDHVVDLFVVPRLAALRLQRIGIFVAFVARDLAAEHAVRFGPIMFGPPLSKLWQIAHFFATSAPVGSALASRVAS